MRLRLRLRPELSERADVPHRDHEVIVLGAGPAGCAAATLLARRSHRVVLVRPPASPSHALAESIPPSSRRLFEELGALDALESAAFTPNEGNSIWWAGSDPRREDFPAGRTGFHTDKLGLENVLVEVARSAGVEVLDGHSARRAEEVAGGWVIHCEATDGDERSLRAPWVVDATGRHGFLARGEGRVPDRSTTTLALVGRWRMAGGWGGDDAGHTYIESYANGWAWSVPLSPEVRCFTAMVDQRHAALEGVDITAMLDRELSRTRHVGPARAGATADGEAWACPASLYTAESFGRTGLLLAGDAGSFIDPLSSFGVKKALSSGWLAAIVAHTALVDPAMTNDALEFFNEREREVYRSYRRISATYFAEAAAHHATPYWTARADAAAAAGVASDGDLSDPDLFRPDVPETHVRAAFEEITRREHLAATPGASLRSFERAGIEGYRIVRQTHLGSRSCPSGIRHVRGVDLVRLVEVAPRFPVVPDGWTAYNSAAPPVSLPDYLTALATAFAVGLLEHGSG